MSKKPKTRVSRRSLAMKGPFSAFETYKEGGFVYRAFKDSPDRRRVAELLGYEIVTEEKGSKSKDRDKSFSSSVTVTGRLGTDHVLYKIPEDMYNEYRAEYDQETDQMEEDLLGKGSSDKILERKTIT